MYITNKTVPEKSKEELNITSMCLLIHSGIWNCSVEGYFVTVDHIEAVLPFSLLSTTLFLHCSVHWFTIFS